MPTRPRTRTSKSSTTRSDRKSEGTDLEIPHISRNGTSKKSTGNIYNTLKNTKWFGVNSLIIIGGAIVLALLLLFVPMFSAIKVLEVTDIIITTVQKQVPETVTENVPTKVYVGYMEEQGESYGVYAPPIIIITGPDEGGAGASADHGYGASANYGPIYGPYYNNYGPGRRYQVDPSDEIVDFQQTNAPDHSLTITLTNAEGKSTVYRDIDTYDLTKTGQCDIPTIVTKMHTVSEQQPKQVTKEEAIPIRINLVQLLVNAANNPTRETVVQFLRETNDAMNKVADSLKSPDMYSQDPNKVSSAFSVVKQQLIIAEGQIQGLTNSSNVPELAEMKGAVLRAAAAMDSLLDQAITAIKTGNVAQAEEVGLKFDQWASSADVIKADELQRSLQSKYNIPDSEIHSMPN
jgi:hypothetical protein